MIKLKNIRLILIILPAFLILDYFTWSPPKALKDAEVLVIEGWLPEEVLQSIDPATLRSYDYIVTTGVSLPPCFIMPQRGSLIFFPDKEKTESQDTAGKLIQLNARGTVHRRNGAGFVLYVDTLMLDTFYTGKRMKTYTSRLAFDHPDIDSIRLYFFNDGLHRGKDKNLCIESVRFSGESLSPYGKEVYYDRFDHDGIHRTSNEAFSYAELAAQILEEAGTDPEHIIPVEAAGKSRFRTMDSALGFREWYEKQFKETVNITILTTSLHQRKTLATYKKVMKEWNPETGLIIAAPDTQDEREHSPFKKAGEYLSFVLYRIFVLPFH